ncbi:FUSC family protein [Pseudogulbenkiania ferrooxidans]|uniref:Fusaric acid resistance protein conserved region n=1 Tax=Pseudogulbenkiania ferrooxidans 2002 TaxID=279714 RepID=B9Z0F3_9NEIS|nr:FUSC family protein [Pseudogulbenkiania ferrooxidans]EEG09559.1 Fusaric acid resistance protein conserved region [Pseudogulbenkiania ferrooxidans 2002]
MMTLPSWRDWLFSAKTFLAAILALYIGMALGLPRPYWAMSTVYIVSHPLIGATRSKGLYRVIGTLIGGAAAILFVPRFVNEPIMLSLVISLWTGTLLCLSLRDRTPRNYLFMLSAYTLPMIALPAVSQPEAVFDIALARSEEIVLGIVCASVVASIVFPSKVAPVLEARIGAWFKDAGAWAAEALSPAFASSHPATRHRLAADILSLDQYITHLAYDAANADMVHTTRELQSRMSMLLPILSSLTATLDAARKLEQGVPAPLTGLMKAIARWILSSPGARGRDEAARFQRQLADARRSGPDAEWNDLLIAHAVTRLQSLIRLWQDCLDLRDMIARGEADTAWKPAYRRWELGGKARHYDHGMILFAAASASLAIFLSCLLWIGMGWNDGASAVILGAVSSCFFAAQDEPAPLIRTFFTWAAVSIPLTAVLLFLIIPAAHEFETLALMLAIPFLAIGTLASHPRFTMAAMLLTVNTASFLGLQGAYDADFTAFFNSSVAGVCGVLFALCWTLLTRPFGAELAMRRLLRASWKDLAETAAGSHRGDYANLTSHMLDRLGLLVPRLAASDDDHGDAGFGELRVGFSTLDLQRDEHRLPETAHVAIDRVLQSVAGHYRECVGHHGQRQPPASLREEIDRALSLTKAELGRAAREAQNALVELRITLFPDAARFVALTGVPATGPSAGETP